MNSTEQQAFLRATAWLRPFTRWAATFSFRTTGYLPPAIRNLPLVLVKKLLLHYRQRVQASCTLK